MANLNKPGEVKINEYKKPSTRRASKKEFELISEMRDHMAMAMHDLQRIYDAKNAKTINFEKSDEAKRMKGRIGSLQRLINSKVFGRAGKKKQKTRMLKVGCASCGYTSRITLSWIETGVPACPNVHCERKGVDMEVEFGQLENQSDDGDERNDDILENIEQLKVELANERIANMEQNDVANRENDPELAAMLEESDHWLKTVKNIFGEKSESGDTEMILAPRKTGKIDRNDKALMELVNRGLIKDDYADFPDAVIRKPKGEKK